MSFFASFFTVILSAYLFSVAIPNEIFHFGNALAGFLCFVPLYLVFFKTKSRIQTALFYSFFVSATHLMSSFWLINFQDFAIFTLGASTLAYFMLAFPFGIFFHHVFSNSSLQLRPFLFALGLTLWEYFKSSGFLAYPWGTIAMTTLSLKHFIQFADVTGVWGISYMMALISAMEGECVLALFGLTEGFKRCNLQKSKNRPLLAPLFITLFLVLIINVYGALALHNKETPERGISLLLVQQNSDPWYDFLDESLKSGQDLTREGLKKFPNSDLVVWSESSLSMAYEEYKSLYESTPNNDAFIPFLKEIKKPILIGTQLRGKDDESETFNGVVLLDEDAEVLGSYAKMQLVPFAEFLPFIDHPLVQKFFDRLVGFSSGYNQGAHYKIFNIKNEEGERINFACPICYEDAFPSLCASLHERGSDLLINLTNDSWSKTHSAEYQHFAISYFRAIELRTPLVRSTNSGYTCVVDPWGNILADLPLFKEGVLNVEVPIYSRKTTPYALFKDWLPTLLFIILIRYIWKSQKLYTKRKNEWAHVAFHWQKEKEKTFKPSIKRSAKVGRFVGISHISKKHPPKTTGSRAVSSKA